MNPTLSKLLSPLVDTAVDRALHVVHDLERSALTRGGVVGTAVGHLAGAAVEAGRDFSRVRAREEAILARIREAVATGVTSIRVTSNPADPRDFAVNRVAVANLVERMGSAIRILEVGGPGLDVAHVTILIHDRAGLNAYDDDYFRRNATLYGAEFAAKARERAAELMKLIR